MRARALAGLVLLSACAAAGQEPVLGRSPNGCTAAPDLHLATALAAGLQAASGSTGGTATLLPDAPCLAVGPGQVSTYAAFRLPERAGPAMLHVESRPAGRALFAPRLLLFDAAGQPTRALGADAFAFRGSALAALVRLDPREAFAVVASDPQRVGAAVQRIGSRVDQVMVPIGVGFIMIPSSSEQRHETVFAHNGEIAMQLRPVPELRIP